MTFPSITGSTGAGNVPLPPVGRDCMGEWSDKDVSGQVSRLAEILARFVR